MSVGDTILAGTIVTLAVIAGLTLLGMTVMMTVDAFGVLSTVFFGTVGLFGLLLWVAPAPTILILGLIGLAALIGIAGPMIIGAFIGRRGLNTSWPPQQEQMFATYETRAASSHMVAMAAGAGAGVLSFLFAVGVSLGVTPEDNDISKTMNMENLSSSPSSSTPAEKPAN